MEQMLEKMNRQLSERQAGQGIVPSLELFQHIHQDCRHFWAVAVGPLNERMAEMMQNELGRIIEQALISAGEDTSPGSIPLTVVSAYLAGAFLNLLKWWLKAGMPYTPEEMDRIFRQLALPGVWATLEKKSE